MSTKSSNHGFTLVEVMVAMAIVALAVSSLLFSVGKQVDNSAYLREKILAQWVALNVLQEAQLIARVSEKFPDEKTSGDIKLADRQWQWEMHSSKTDDENIVQLDVKVFAGETRNVDNSNDDPITSVSGYIDKYYEPEAINTQRNDDVGLGDNQSINRADGSTEQLDSIEPELDENGEPP